MGITFTGVSPRSLGDLLKGYGIMAVIGQKWPQARFYWDAADHLVVLQDDLHEDEIIAEIHGCLPDWARNVSQAFAPERGSKEQDKKKVPSKLTRQANFDEFSTELAEAAWGAAVPDRPKDKADTRSHPWFGSHGQDGSGDYFAQLDKLSLSGPSRSRTNDPDDSLKWSLFRHGSPSVRSILKSGGVFFPQPMKRYATGVRYWVREGDAPVSAWCYALAVRGALFLRGSLRRMRFARYDYPAFPFLFEGAQGSEVHLPTWTEKHPRTLTELRIEIAQFQVRLKGDAVAGNAAEFRAAVTSRGVAAAFDKFHRFVLEERRPGQQQYLQQAILRGVTYVGRTGSMEVRLLVAPLAQTGWLNRLETKGRLGKKSDPAAKKRAECRQAIEDAIHAAIDEPLPERFIGILEQIWVTNQLLAAHTKDSDAAGPYSSPSPPLDTTAWERALQSKLEHSAEHRIARAIGSILGAWAEKAKLGQNPTETLDTDDAIDGASGRIRKGIGGLLAQLLPLDERRNWNKERGADVISWAGLNPPQDFAELLWRRWLMSAGSTLGHLALRARRTAPLADAARLLRGELDVKQIHRLVPLYALLDWRNRHEVEWSPKVATPSAIPPAYAILRCWVDLAIYPPKDKAGERDGTIIRLLAVGRPQEASHAAALALRRLRIRGLPVRQGDARPFGKAVANAEVVVSSDEAPRLALAVLVPISTNDMLVLADRLRVESPERQTKEVAT